MSKTDFSIHFIQIARIRYIVFKQQVRYKFCTVCVFLRFGKEVFFRFGSALCFGFRFGRLAGFFCIFRLFGFYNIRFRQLQVFFQLGEQTFARIGKFVFAAIQIQFAYKAGNVRFFIFGGHFEHSVQKFTVDFFVYVFKLT